MVDVEHLKQVRGNTQRKLLKKSNVIGVGVGFKESDGQKSSDLSLKVLVRHKVPVNALASKDLVPREMDGVRTDVTPVGKVVAFQSPRDRYRPAPGGVSIGHFSITAGTLGVVVRDKHTDELLILSNNHVMANSNDAEKGDAILQPGPADGGRAASDKIAELERFIRLQYMGGNDDGGGNGGGGSSCPIAKSITSVLNVMAGTVGSKTRVTAVAAEPVNLVDAAVAKPMQSNLVTQEIQEIGQVSGTVDAAIGMSVKKSGRTTGFTTGEITVLDATINVGYGGGRTAHFEHQILSNDMSDPGDSGSLIVDDQNRAVGLLFAGSDAVTVFSPIQTVLDALNLKF